MTGRRTKWVCQKKDCRNDEMKFLLAVLGCGSALRNAVVPEVEILGNRKGLRALAAICSGLAELTSEQLLTPANHYHLDEDFWGTEKGSMPLIVCVTDKEEW